MIKNCLKYTMITAQGVCCFLSAKALYRHAFLAVHLQQTAIINIISHL